MNGLQPPHELNLSTGSNVALNWKKFRKAYVNYELATGLSDKPAKVRLATFLHVIGEAGLEKYESFNLKLDEDDNEERDVIKIVLQKFDDDCKPRTNILVERYNFLKREQEMNEDIDHYVTQLKLLIASCEYPNEEEAIRDQVVLNMNDSTAREKILDKAQFDSKVPDLNQVVNMIKNYESRKIQQKNWTKLNEDEKDILKIRRREKDIKKPNSNRMSESDENIKNCKYCGYDHKRNQCPAFGKTCNKCQKLNHFAKMCMNNVQNKYQKKYVERIDDETKSTCTNMSEIDYNLNMVRQKKKCNRDISIKDYIIMNVNGVNCKFLIDSGATCNIIPLGAIKLMKKDSFNINKRDKAELSLFDESKISSYGSGEFQCKRNGRKFNINFQIVDREVVPILGSKTSKELKFIKILQSDDCCKVEQKENLTENLIKIKYGDVFSGLGRIGNKCKIEIDERFKPVVHAQRKVPYALTTKLKEHLIQLEEKGVIKKVSKPTDWVSSLVIVPKSNDDIRVCLDPTDLNKAIKRPYFPLPVVEDVLTKLEGARIFTSLDAKSGYWQVELDEESQELTCFNTPFGRYVFKRLPFGVKSASEEFQMRLVEALDGIDNIAIVADDILVYGVGDTDEQAEKNHDNTLRTLLIRCREKNLKLNYDKLQLKKKELKFIGHIISADGVRPDPTKVEAIQVMKAPRNRRELKQFLGMINYLGKFLPKLSEESEKLRLLLKKETQWQWDAMHERCFKTLKDLVSAAPVLKYYDVDEEVTIQCDASQKGLGAVLLQKGQPVSYASRSLTDTEESYAQIEKEMLAIVFAANHFDSYIIGKDVSVESDHRPLETIFKKPLLKCPKRLQRMRLELQRYSLDVRYKRGNELYIADALSRDFIIRKDKEHVLITELEEIDMRSNLAVAPERLSEIEEESKIDPEMNILRAYIADGWPESRHEIKDVVKAYYDYRDELSLDQGVLFRGEKVIIPKKLRYKIMTKIHTGHVGASGCIQRARNIIFWPHMAKEIKDYISRCSTCNKFSNEQTKEPMIRDELPTRPWQKVASDIFTLNQENYIILADYYSNFFEVNLLKTMTSNTVIKILRENFARYGIPEVLVTDNARQYTSQEFKEFAKKFSFSHKTSSPYHPEGNGKAENAVKIAKSILKKCKDSNEDPYLGLLEWRNTPSSGLETSPAQRFMARRLNSQITIHNDLLKPAIIDEMSTMKKLKDRQEIQHNKGSKALEELKEGDIVRFKLFGGDKEWKKAICIKKVSPRSYILRMEGGKCYRRNRRDIKKSTEKMDIVNTRSYSPEFNFTHEDRLEVTEKQAPEHSLRRSTRMRKPPDYYK